MKNYLRQRIVIDAKHAIALAEQQATVEHKGLRGRLRELIAQRLIRPWLPPFVGCGTGTIINGKDERYRRSTQDDLIIFDRQLMPPILIEEAQAEGVFLNNSVLARLEIKSKITATEIRSYAEATKDYLDVGLVWKRNFDAGVARTMGIRSCLLAFDSDIKESEITRYLRILSEVSCPVEAASSLCVLGKGFWMRRPIDQYATWYRLRCDEPGEQLACFAASLSSTVVLAHCERTGLDFHRTLAEGIGLFFPDESEWDVDPRAPA